MARRKRQVEAVVPDDPERFEAAVEAFRQRVPITRLGWNRLKQAARERAFTVAAVSQTELLNDVWLAIDDAIANGSTFGEFTKTVTESLTAAWEGSVADPAHRIENIYRTNVQTAYSAGRYHQLNDPAVKKRRPYQQFRAIEDSRTSDICKDLDGVVLPADHPFWQNHQPPLHYMCRSHVVPLSVDEASEEGVTASKDIPEGEPLKGFGKPPTGPAEWKPDLTKYPAPLRDALQKKLTNP